MGHAGWNALSSWFGTGPVLTGRMITASCHLGAVDRPVNSGLRYSIMTGNKLVWCMCSPPWFHPPDELMSDIRFPFCSWGKHLALDWKCSSPFTRWLLTLTVCYILCYQSLEVLCSTKAAHLFAWKLKWQVEICSDSVYSWGEVQRGDNSPWDCHNVLLQYTWWFEQLLIGKKCLQIWACSFVKRYSDGKVPEV